jgi:hypothetical protein
MSPNQTKSLKKKGKLTIFEISHPSSFGKMKNLTGALHFSGLCMHLYIRKSRENTEKIRDQLGRIVNGSTPTERPIEANFLRRCG